MIRFLLFISLSISIFAGSYAEPDNRSQAKNILKMIDLDYKKTFLNDCDYHYDPHSCMDKSIVDTKSCNVQEDNTTMTWMQIVPDTFYGRHKACMIEKPCINIFTKEPFGSPLCCRRKDTQYREMEADLFNLVPVVTSLAMLQKGRIFGVVKVPTERLGDVKMDKNYLEPPNCVKGDVARVYLYMDARYSLELAPEQRSVFLKWHKEDGVDAKECKLAKLFQKIQGGENPWLKTWCVNR